MSENNGGAAARGTAPADHEGRVREAFDGLNAALGGQATAEVRESLQRLREAVLERDADRLRGHLAEVKERHGWVYAELMRHPRLAALVNELALFGL